MENKNYSIGTYSISPDGNSFNYSAPSFLSDETVKNVLVEKIGHPKKVEETDNSFDDILYAVAKVPKDK